MTLLKHKSDVNLSFLLLHKGAYSVSKGHFLAARKAFSGFEKGVAQKLFRGALPPDPLILTNIVHQSPRNLDPPLKIGHGTGRENANPP